METRIKSLPDFRLPNYPNESLRLDAQPLSIIDIAKQQTTTSNSPAQEQISTTPKPTPAIGISTILYNWHPNTLAAFLDLDAWFSLTWSLIPSPPPTSNTNTKPSTTPPPARLEIGRISNQITFGTLSSDGDTWSLMLTFNIIPSGPQRGKWIANTKESMLGDTDLTDETEIERLAGEWVEKCVQDRCWETSKSVKHTLHVEYAPMDVWGDGIPMSPHWLYDALDLTKCTNCKVSAKSEGVAELQRCGRCGTATYCSGMCQKADWKVHKFVCTMELQERGQMLKISEKGGLIGWDEERLFAVEGEGVESANCNFREGVLKRCRPKRI
ncbi:hypothetical protein NX059_000403 [Plenodomus lindquistii]|nr:hypothetical protein NX059_000403 [Plenodomus lindquistii]